MATIHGPFSFDTEGGADVLAFTFNSSTGAGIGGGNGFWGHDTDDSPSTGVGPTSGQGGNPDGYVYTEASSPTAVNHTFTMEFGTALDAASENWEIEFYTNQRGDSNAATCQVQINESGAGWVNVGAEFGGSGDPDKVDTGGAQIWTLRTVDLSSGGSNTNPSTLVRLLLTMPPSGTVWHNDYGIDTVTITGVDAPINISSVSPDPMDDAVFGASVAGSGFEAIQGTGIVEMGDSADYGTANLVPQPVFSWSNSMVSITSNLGGQTPTNKFMFVTNDSGGVSPGYPFVMRRQQAISLTASANISTSGEDTTSQLAAPSGKSTGDFGGGRIQDDENPGDNVDLGGDEYREDEWSFQPTNEALEGGTYQFRVLIDGSPVDTATVTPELTISSGESVSGAVTSPSVTVTGSAAFRESVVGASTGPSSAVVGEVQPPIPSLQYAVRHGVPPLAAGNQDIDFGFEVKAAYVFWVATDAASGVPLTSHGHGVGFFDGTDVAYMALGSASGGAHHRHGSDAFIRMLEDDSFETNPEATASSIGTGIRLNWSVADDGGQSFQWMIVGFAEGTTAEIGTGLVSDAGVTGLSLTPDMVMLLTAGMSADPDHSDAEGSVSFGVFNATDQWCLSAYNSDGGDADKHSILKDDICLAKMDAAGHDWEMSSPVITGNSFSWIGTDTDRFFYMALSFSGAIPEIGTFLKEDSGVDTTTQQMPDLGFEPGALMLVTASDTDQDETTPNNARWSIGATDGSSEFSTQGSDTIAGGAIQKWFDDAILMTSQTANFVDAQGTITDLARTDPTITWDVSDTDQTVIGFIAFNPGTTTETVDGAVTAPSATVTGSTSIREDVSSAVTAPSATVTGQTSFREDLSGVITAPSPAITGGVGRRETSAGAVTGPSALVAGSVDPHSSVAGAVAGPGNLVTGVVGFREDVSGALVAPSASLVGSADILKLVSGTVVVPPAVVTGSTSIREDITGAIVAPSATVTGQTSFREDVSGAIVAPSATVTGNVDSFKQVEGAIVTPSATVAGSADVFKLVSGAVVAPPATAAGDVGKREAVSGASVSPPPTVTGVVVVQTENETVFAVIGAPLPVVTGSAQTVKLVDGAVTAPSATVTGQTRFHEVASGAVDAPPVVTSGLAQTVKLVAGVAIAPVATSTGSTALREVVSGAIVVPSAIVAGSAQPQGDNESVAGVIAASSATVTGSTIDRLVIAGGAISPAPLVGGIAGKRESVFGAVNSTAGQVSGQARFREVASGAVLAPVATVVGVTDSKLPVSGVTTAPLANVTGAAEVFKPISAVLIAPAATVSGSTTVFKQAAGVVTAPSATVSGLLVNQEADYVLHNSIAVSAAFANSIQVALAMVNPITLTQPLNCAIIVG